MSQKNFNWLEQKETGRIIGHKKFRFGPDLNSNRFHKIQEMVNHNKSSNVNWIECLPNLTNTN